MLVNDLSVFDLWELSRPALPPRSRLYHLDPIGIGTPYVESLTGYAARLAQAHCVDVRKLVVAEILPLMGRPHLLGPVNRGLSAFWQKETRALNGTRTLAADLAQTIESLTLRHDLRFLTLLSWSEVLPPKGLLRFERAWCPACYEEWHQTGQTIYEPLLWSLVAVGACPRHHRRLQLRCPYPDCHRSLSPLAQRSRPGHCSQCGRWLGMALAPVGNDVLMEDELRWQTWVVQAVGELLAAMPRLPAAPARDCVARGIDRHVGQLTAGNTAALARALELRPSQLWHWQRGRSMPSLLLLLQMCRALGVMPLDFLSGKVVTTTPVGKGEQTLPRELPGRPQAARRRFDLAAMRDILEAVIASDEWPPPSTREIARRVRIHHSSLSQQLSEQCRAISARYLAYRRKMGEMRVQRLCAEIRRAVFEVHRQRLYPSSYRVARLITKPAFIRDHAAQVAWRQALAELGWRVAQLPSR